MKKMKTSSEPRDRLSELPDSLILNIFELLPLRYVVRTQILSHRWKKLWTLTPYLHFDNTSTSDDEKFRNFVNRFLICWRGTRIHKFKLSGKAIGKSIFGDVDLWVRFAVDNGVEEVETLFETVGLNPDEENYCVPKCLYSCSSLQKLSFFGSIMEIDGNVMQWNQLKSLNIKCFRITQHSIDQILSKCPVLEVFKLSFVDKDNNLSLTFRSSSLKELSVDKRRKDGRFSYDIFKDTELKICTPNLEILSIVGGMYGNCLLMNVSSLTHATLSFDMHINMGIPLKQFVSTLRHVMNQIVPTLRHVEGLTLSNCCFKVLGSLIVNPPPMPGVMFLNLNGSFGRLQEMVRLLEIFPELKTLVLHEDNVSNNMMKFKSKPSKSFLVELRNVKVTWNMHDFSIFPLIKILLKYASKLEKMVFRVKRNVPASANSMFLASQKLLKMPRSSPTAKLILCEY